MSETIDFLDVGATYDELKEELDSAYARVMQSGNFLLGPELDAFEDEFSRYCGMSHAVGVGSGLDALRLILEGMGVGPGDEVIVPAHTFIATWLAVAACGATPVGVDVDAGTCNLDPDRIPQAVTPRTRAIIAVHLYGQPAGMTRIISMGDRFGLPVIEDAAQAHGARYHGRRTGSLAYAAAFSFYPAKNLGAYGDGGAVVCNDMDLIERVRMLRNYGSRHKYYHEMAGSNSRLDELQAAFLRVKLKHLDRWNRNRQRLAYLYSSRLRGCPGLVLPAIGRRIEPVWHLYAVRTRQRDALQDYLQTQGISTQVHYPVPVYRCAPFQDDTGPARFPVTEEASATTLSLPIGPHLAEADVEHIVATVNTWFAGEADTETRRLA